MQQNTTALSNSASIIIDAIEAIKEQMSDASYSALCTNVTNNLLRSANMLRTMAGQAAVGDEISQLPPLGPVQTFHGKEVIQGNVVAKTDTMPNDQEKEAFLKRRDELRANFPDMDNEDLLKSLKQPFGAAYIRAVAKSVNHQDYKDAEIDVEFLDEVRELIIEENKKAEAVDTADKGAAILLNATKEETPAKKEEKKSKK